MRRGQATVEYAMLVTAIVVGVCLLVRFATPVEALARAVAHAVAPAPAHRRAPGHRGPRRPPHRRERVCLCPGAPPG